MSVFCSQDPCCGKPSHHKTEQAAKRQAANATLNSGSQWRGGVASGSGALWQFGPDQPCLGPAGKRGQAGAYRYGGVRQGGARTDVRYPDGPPTARGPGGGNLRSFGDYLAAGGRPTPLQLRCHNPGALANHLRHRKAAHQPKVADRQTGGGV